jgi:hypothetical protein
MGTIFLVILVLPLLGIISAYPTAVPGDMARVVSG